MEPTDVVSNDDRRNDRPHVRARSCDSATRSGSHLPKASTEGGEMSEWNRLSWSATTTVGTTPRRLTESLLNLLPLPPATDVDIDHAESCLRRRCWRQRWLAGHSSSSKSLVTKGVAEPRSGLGLFLRDSLLDIVPRRGTINKKFGHQGSRTLAHFYTRT
jgi:hypothetical protein